MGREDSYDKRVKPAVGFIKLQPQALSSAGSYRVQGVPLPPYDFTECIYEDDYSNPLPLSDTSAGLIPTGQGHLL